ncbi:MAG: TonB-dependent receptor [Opitutaceae bacterium]|nr:TonB-dependent receptor [Cephaloticoccus sp.]MCP5531519.1 TonB-dependent receptor [Opitutaceae bacterium]
MTYPRSLYSSPATVVLRFLFVCLLSAGLACAAAVKKKYDLPGADAAQTLKAFSDQSGEQIVYPVERVKGVQTNAIKGEFTAREALDLMLAGTGLSVVQDDRTGAFTVRRNDPPQVPVRPDVSDGSTAATNGADGTIRMARLEVLGTRIRQTEAFGPAPMSNYDDEYIRASGALTLADFLNRLPQNYAGISAGRGSTPNELNPEFGSRTETTTPPFNFVLGASAVPANATGQSGVGLRGLGAGSTLVLVDGRRVAQSSVGNAGTDSRQGFVDLNTIPLGMVERIEVVTDGTSALYGADAVAGVINIVLKKNWSGSELSARYKGAFDGGGHERSLSLIHGFNHGPLHGTVGLDYYKRADLKADQRSFSRQQDHTGIVEGYDPVTGAPVYGSNYLLNYGYPATVQARTGNLNGVTANGNPTRVALAPGGLTATPTNTTGFIGVAPTGTATLASASGARRGNSAEFLDLIPPSERKALTANLGYRLPYAMEAYTRYSYSNVQGSFSSQPPIFAASASTGFGNFASIVPAAYNPFGQDVLVGMIAYEFGSVVQSTETTANNLLVGLKGTWGETWQWDVSAGWQKQDFSRVTRDFNGALITAALANPDASQRINPFVDARAEGAPDQSALFDRMARYITFDGITKQTNVDFIADGGLFDLPGGQTKMAAGLSYEYAENSGRSVTPSAALTPVVTTTTTGGSRKTQAVFSELSVPLFGQSNARAGLQRFDLQLAIRYEDRSDAGSVSVPKVGFTWAPARPVLLRGSYSEGYRAPSLTEYQQVVGGTFTTNSLRDPRRGNNVTPGVRVTRAANTGLEPETSSTEFLGLVLEPPSVEGLSLQFNYYRTEQKNVIQVLTEQQIVNNEASFADRVIRAAADPTDIANGWPGRITEVNRALINFGRVRNHSLDFAAEYRLPWQEFGSWRLGLNASRTLKSEREVRPGEPVIDDISDTLSPPKWRVAGSLFWSKGPFSASMFVNYLSGFETNTGGNTRAPGSIPSQMVIDARLGYEFQKGLIREYLKGTKVSLGIGNVLDEEPPFSDTIFGYNGALHSPLGRTYEFALSIPF